MRHSIRGFREVSVEGHNFGVWVAIQRFMCVFEKEQHVRKNGSVLHKSILIFGKIGGLVLESYIDAFSKNFAFNVLVISKCGASESSDNFGLRTGSIGPGVEKEFY